jgi:glycosyltransferase involved in cell wall biosynthesis
MTATCELVMPCRDEAGALPDLLAQVPEGIRAIVVNNGSADDTARIAARCGARVVEEPRPGYGAAVNAGICAARAEWVAVIDGDGSLDPGDVRRLLEHARSLSAPVSAPTARTGTVRDATGGQAGPVMVVGRRRPVTRGVWPWHARLGNAAVVRLLRWRTGLTVRDIAPLRVCRRKDLLALDVRDRRFGYPVELLVRAAASGWRLVEVDVDYRPRAAGTHSKVSGSVTGSLRAAHDFARVLW